VSAAVSEDVRLVLPRLHAAQRIVTSEARRFNVVDCGRRFGKTVLGIDREVHPALAGYPVGWFAPTYKMLADAWRQMRAVLLPVTAASDATEHRIELVTGGVVEMWSLTDPNSARGRKYKRVVVDEAATVARLEEAWTAVIRPTLTDYRGDAYFLSTPKGLNYFYTLFEWGVDPCREEWAAWKMPTSANPFISPDEIEAARSELPAETFEQEYLAEFKQNAGAVFRNVDACLTAEPTSPDAHRGHLTVMGADLAQSHDFTALSVGCATCRREVALDRFNQLDWATQRGRILTLAARWNVADLLVERNSIGQPNLEALAEENPKARGFDTTPTSKGPLVRSMALAFERAEFQFLPDPVGRNELLAYEVKVSAETGRPKYSAPEGRHDDTIIARALMLRAALTGGPALDAQAAALFARPA
jgi:hypothetical protein